MTLSIAELKGHLEKLPENDRVDLVDFLLATLPGATTGILDEGWAPLIQQRRDEMLSGREPGIPLEQVIVQLREKFQ